MVHEHDTEQPLLTVRRLGKRYGDGCGHCAESRDSAMPCRYCGSAWGCREISFELYPGEILGIVGESGSGKSTLVRCLNFDRTASEGEVLLAGYKGGRVNVLRESAQQQKYIKDHMLGMVYQHPHLGLRMSFSSSGNIAEKLLAAGHYHVGHIRNRAAELLTRMEIPASRMDEAPLRFSGGMQQRVQIAKALANHPPLLLLDEVTTGLDLSVQAKVLDLIRELQREFKIAMIVISHDLGVIRMLAERTLVLKNGSVIEQGLTDQILEDPQHPYTQLLVHSML